MEIFVSYASSNNVVAERISLTLMADGHTVFMDRAALAEGKEFDKRIQAAVAKADVFIFLISPDSVRSGSYALTELKFAKKRWSHPQSHVLPVVIAATEKSEIPAYLSAVTWLEPDGDIPAEVRESIAKMQADRTWYVEALGQIRRHSRSIAATLLALVIGLALGAWDRSTDDSAQRELLQSTSYRVEEMQAAHNMLARVYFDELWQETERFIADEWLPEMSRRMHEFEEVREGLASGDADAFVELTTARDAVLSDKRNELREQHEAALVNFQYLLSAAYGDILRAHTVLIRASEGSADAEQLADQLAVLGPADVNGEMQSILEELRKNRPRLPESDY